jgi:hypothetical protein
VKSAIGRRTCLIYYRWAIVHMKRSHASSSSSGMLHPRNRPVAEDAACLSRVKTNIHPNCCITLRCSLQARLGEVAPLPHVTFLPHPLNDTRFVLIIARIAEKKRFSGGAGGHRTHLLIRELCPGHRRFTIIEIDTPSHKQGENALMNGLVTTLQASRETMLRT